MIIYHVVLPEAWERHRGGPFYRAPSLDTEGFIHCSFADQVEGVLDRYYRDAECVLILSIETNRLLSKLVAEPSTNDEVFPHIYGEINTDSVIEISERLLSKIN